MTNFRLMTILGQVDSTLVRKIYTSLKIKKIFTLHKNAQINTSAGGRRIWWYTWNTQLLVDCSSSSLSRTASSKSTQIKQAKTTKSQRSPSSRLCIVLYTSIYNLEHIYTNGKTAKTLHFSFSSGHLWNPEVASGAKTKQIVEIRD